MIIKKNKLFFSMSIVLFLSCSVSKNSLTHVYQQAQEKARNNDFDAAITIIETNVKEGKRDYSYYLLHGLYIRYKNPEIYSSLALEDFNKAYKANPEKFDVNYLIGQCYSNMDEYENAIPYLENAYEIYAKDKEGLPPYWDLAEAYLRVKRYDDALKINDEAIISDGSYAWNYLQRGIILSYNGDVDSLTEFYLKAISLNNTDLFLHREYAQRLMEIGLFDRALNIYYSILSDNNKFAWVYADLGFLSMCYGKWDKANDYLSKAESINNMDISTLKYLSFYYFFMKDYNRAYEYDASLRLVKGLSEYVIWYTSQDEYISEYKKDRQFNLLMNVMSACAKNEK
jgi:tetratricopeptide (TPR) repeat protein